MAKLKELMIAHGEKIGLALIAALCLWSIMGNVISNRNPKMLDLPKGEPQEVDKDQINRKVTLVRNQLNTASKNHPDRKTEPVAVEIATSALGRMTGDARTDYFWLYYVQPPEVTIPAPWKEKDIPPSTKNVPPSQRTIIGNPVDFKIKATPKGIAITVKDSPLLNEHFQPGSRRYILFRKEIGFAKDQIDGNLRAGLISSLTGTALAAVGASGKEETKAERPALFGVTRKPAPKADTPEETVEMLAPSGPSRRDYLKARDDINAAAFEAMTQVMEPKNLLNSKWEVVTIAMPALRSSAFPSPADVDNIDVVTNVLINEGGVNAKITYMKEPETDKADKEPADSTTATDAPPETPTSAESDPGPVSPWDAVKIEREIKEKKKEEDKKQAEENIEAGMNPAQHYTYAWLDTDIEENKAYRYAVIFVVSPLPPTQEALDEAGLEHYDNYVQINGMSPYGDFAIPQRSIGDVSMFIEDAEPAEKKPAEQKPNVEKQDPAADGATAASESGEAAKEGEEGVEGAPASAEDKKDKQPTEKKKVEGLLAMWMDSPKEGVGGKFRMPYDDPPYANAYPPPADWINKKNPLPRGAALRTDSTGPLTNLGWAYNKQNLEPCYSDLVYSDLILTPVGKQITVVQAYDGGGTLRVTMTTESGDSQDHTFPFKVQPPSPPLDIRDMLASEPDPNIPGQTRPIKPLRILEPQEIFSRRPGVDVVQIGKKVKKGGKEWDFTTNWAVVDVRKFRVEMEMKRMVNGKWRQGTPPAPRDGWAIILRELDVPEDRDPRVKRIYRMPSGIPKNSSSARYETKIIWEPDTWDRIKDKVSEEK